MNYTYTLTIDTRQFQAALATVSLDLRAWAARRRGQRHLARVITEQPGRRMVREGMSDVLEWLGETP